MNAPQKRQELLSSADQDAGEEMRLTTLQRFDVEHIQRLGPEDLLLAQTLAGHGSTWGNWQTPKSLDANYSPECIRNIDLANRIRHFLPTEPRAANPVELQVEEAVLVLTRFALLMRLAPTGGRGHGRGHVLKPSTIAHNVYSHLPVIIARAIRRKADAPNTKGLLGCLTDADLQEFAGDFFINGEVTRIRSLVGKRLWSDAPPLPDIRQTTAPAAEPAARPPQKVPEPFLPIPDDYLAEIGPRVLWIVQDMGPNLLHLLEALPEELKDIDWSLAPEKIGKHAARHIRDCLDRYPWRDCAGRPLSPPPFPLVTAAERNGTVDPREWPPRTWEHVITLSMTLQAANLFTALLASAGRVGEVANLTRGCMVVEPDGKEYLHGYTYKLSGSLLGDARQWPAPEILCQCLGQQTRLAAAWDWLPNALADRLPQAPRFEDALWISIGVSGRTGEGAQISIKQALVALAVRLGMDPKPGNRWLHPHRFRKTIGRLAGIALHNSPLVLKRLFGHKSIEMTLHYILCDPGIREEAEKVLRELRIMHCADALDEIHEAIRTGQPLPGNGGPGAARLVTAVAAHERQLQESGAVWGEGSAYDLAYLLSAQGQGWRLVSENIVCSKAPGEDGLCQKKRSKGEPNTANCQPECHNRVVLMRKRRDSELIVQSYLDIARQARDDGQLLVLASVMENLQNELENFADLKEQYLTDPEVQSLRALCEESEDAEEST